MEAGGIAFEDALREAQSLGFAEADPTADVDGFDAQAKIAILSTVALGIHPPASEISCRSITRVGAVDFQYARRLGCTIRQVAWVETGEGGWLTASVGPSLVPLGSPLARATGSENLVTVRGQFGGETTYGGRGAGGEPTAVAVVSDLLAIARAVEPPRQTARVRDASPSSEFVAPFYTRFTVADRPGIIAALATVFARHGINIDAVLQESGFPAAARPFVMSLESAPSSLVDRALAEVATLDFNVSPPLAMPLLTTATAPVQVAS
jgi:homoserine dehydrogenase